MSFIGFNSYSFYQVFPPSSLLNHKKHAVARQKISYSSLEKLQRNDKRNSEI